MSHNVNADVFTDPAAIDDLARGVLAAPENADLFIDRAAVIVQLAARVHELRHQLHGAVAEWVSLQIDYQQLRFGEPRAGREELHARAMRYVTTELGLSVSDR